MVVRSRVVVEKGHKDGVIVDEAANDVGIREIIVTHSVVIKTQSFVDLEFVFFNLLFGSRDLLEGPESKLSIVVVDTSIGGACRVLLYFFEFDVLIWLSADLLLEGKISICKVVHLDPVFLVIVLRYGDRTSRIKADAHRNNGVHGDDGLRI
jgi:hypothetical protein